MATKKKAKKKAGKKGLTYKPADRAAARAKLIKERK